MSITTRTHAAVAPMTSQPTVSCPSCGRPAEIVDRFTLASTSGPMEHLRIACAGRHNFTLPAEHTDLDAAAPTVRAIA